MACSRGVLTRNGYEELRQHDAGAVDKDRAMSRLARTAVVFTLAGLAAPAAEAQYACTTDYCIRSQSTSYETPPGWPNVTVAPCCRTHWGTRPGGIDWARATPIMICTARPDYDTSFPNCGDPNNLSQDFPLAYDKPTIAIGVAWPNPKEYRYELTSVPIVDGGDGSCAQFSHQPGKVSNWWIYELKQPRRGSYVFTAALSFRQGEHGYHAVLSNCKLAPPSP
jgi:hypothetical protein